MIRLHLLLLALASLLAFGSASAASDTRDALVRRIVDAQGLTGTFDRQLAEQQQALKDYAQKLFDDAVAARGGKASPKQRAALDRFLGSLPTVLTGHELTEVWLSSYGRDLSEADLRGILRYYQSPLGRKDTAAMRAATPALTRWMAEETRRRVTPLVQQFLKDFGSPDLETLP